MVRKKTLDQLNRESFEYLARETLVTNLAPGGVARGLVETTNRQIADLYDALEIVSTQVYPSLAQGAFLDLLGELVGVTRRSELSATVVADDQALRFYVESGTLGQYLPHPSDAKLGQIPAATTVTSRDGSIQFTVDTAHDFPVNSREAYVGARTSARGSGGNVGRGDLINHSLGVSAVLVTNVSSITTGRDVEGDEAFRSRISNSVLASQSSNETAVRMATLSIPGVADVRLLPGVAGAGSFRAMLIPVGNRVPVQVLQETRQRIRNIAAYGVRVFVEEPIYVPISLTMKLSLERDATRVPILSRVEAAVRDYVGNIRPSEDFVVNRLRQAAFDASRDVLDASILELCIDQKPMVVTNFTLDDDEVFIPDSLLDDPLRIL